jgi:hypothetical protein
MIKSRASQYCHVLIFAETMEYGRELQQEEALEEIIREVGDDDIITS